MSVRHGALHWKEERAGIWKEKEGTIVADFSIEERRIAGSQGLLKKGTLFLQLYLGDGEGG